MDEQEVLPQIRRWRKEGTLGENRDLIVQAIRMHYDSVFTEKVGYSLKSVSAEAWQSSGEGSVQPLRLAVLSNFTVESFPLMLRPLLLCEGIWPYTYLAGFNQYVYELIHANSGLYQHSPQLTICLLDEHIVLDELPKDWEIEDLEEACQRKLKQLGQLMEIYHQQATGLIALHTIPMSPNLYNTKIDYKTKARLSQIWRAFNMGLLQLSDTWSQVITLDTEVLLQEHETTKLQDARLAVYGSFYFTSEVLFGFAAEAAKIARNYVGMTKKVLVLDLDNTLWGGIVGDDGVDGVQLGNDAPGKAFVLFQKRLKQLKNQGVLLTICSKNEEAVVRQMFEQHPAMQLTLDDITLIRANWEPKSENIRFIAKALNVGLDSLVFVDDNPFERNQIREALPMVIVPELDKDPSYYEETLLSSGWFNTVKLTASDRKRTDQYRKEAERELLKESSQGIEDYLHSLDLQVNLLPADSFNLPRLAQLTLRTNQFNMTTRRLQESEVAALQENDAYWVFGFQSQDRFGDYGLIGCVVLEKSPDSWRIDNFMMSCRVFSRQIETAVLRYVLGQAKEAGVKQVYGDYIPTAKNVIVKDFYVQHGFVPTQPQPDSDRPLQRYVHHLDVIPQAVPWIQMKTEKEAVHP
ncbi:HAD-IIIC family phosphatase [Paenibacillus senegalimassiliensis]|uniref:HAD-IIIC family phosphatase n=1 Tax=Paenibacillus senegalimassiliensis TaxID=1737426 RepID=UPI00073E87A4|nr:HAD-IIIC family phosphatase [Paenibacillus senegalimassiliensis]